MYSLGLLKICWSWGCRNQRCWSSPVLLTRRHARLIIRISGSILGGGGKLQTSVLFIIIKIWLFLCSHGSSPHAPIPPPECWWSQRLQSTICSIIFNYPVFTVSIISPKLNSGQKSLVDWLTGQLSSIIITSDWCHACCGSLPTLLHSLLSHHYNAEFPKVFGWFKKICDCIKKKSCSARNVKVEMWTCTFDVFHICFAFSTLTPRLWRPKVPEKPFSSWCTAFQSADK